MATGQLTATVKDIFTGLAIQGVIVEILDGSIIINSQTTDSSGAFTTSNLQLGSYNLQVTKPPYQQVSKEVLVSQSLVTLADIYLHPLNIYGQKADGAFQPIITNNMNALLLSNQLEGACRIGNYYGATTGAQTISANGYFAVQLTNPADSGKTVHLGKISGGSTGASVVDIIKNGTFDNGTAISPTRWNYGFDNTTNMSVKWLAQGSDPTNTGDLQTSIVSIGIPMVVDVCGELIIPPSYSMVMRTYNPSAQDSQLAFTITWWEESL